MRWVGRPCPPYPMSLMKRRKSASNRPVVSRAVESENSRPRGQLKTGVGVLEWNLRTNKVVWNPELAAIFGLEPDVMKSYADFRARIHPDDSAVVEYARNAVVRHYERLSVEFRIIRPDGRVRWISATGGILYDEVTGEPTRIIGNSTDITERKRAEERQHALVAELHHRVKNVLATVSAVVSRTRQGSRSVESFAMALEGRIHSMAIAHELLSSARWRGISLRELVRCELAPYATRDNAEIRGPEVILHPQAGQAMAIVLHELATNAAKYGALSTENAHVSIRWYCPLNGSQRPVVLEWQETGGPPVVAPRKSSYGTGIIRDLIPYELGGTVDYVLAPGGVQCRLELPAAWISSEGGRAATPNACASSRRRNAGTP
jgi:PAS domain S-box-containing protein